MPKILTLSNGSKIQYFTKEDLLSEGKLQGIDYNEMQIDEVKDISIKNFKKLKIRGEDKANRDTGLISD